MPARPDLSIVSDIGTTEDTIYIYPSLNDNAINVPQTITPTTSVGSNIVEPEIINVSTNTQNNQNSTQVNPAVLEISESVSTITNTKPNTNTSGVKSYISGGTTKNNTIVLSKPKPNYVMYAIVGVLGILVVNELFFNTKN
jgi:hypothetical protein